MKRRLAGQRQSRALGTHILGGILGALVESSNRSSDEAFHSLIFGFVFLDPLYFPYCNERIVWKRHALYF